MRGVRGWGVKAMFSQRLLEDHSVLYFGPHRVPVYWAPFSVAPSCEVRTMPRKKYPSSTRYLPWIVVAVILTCCVNVGWAEKETILHNFVDLPHGANPQSNVIADAAGNLYGTTYAGGTYGFGTVFRLSLGSGGKWTEKVLYSFTGTSDGGRPAAGVIFDSAGNLYGATAYGGNYQNACTYDGCGTIFKLSPAASGQWTESTLYTFTGAPNDGQNPVASLVFDVAGNLYGTTESGGTYGRGWTGTVFELSPSSNGTWTETILHNFSNGPDGASPLASLIFDSAGNLYGTTEYGGDVNCNGPRKNTTCGTVFELSPDGNNTWTETVLHTFLYSDGAYPAGSLAFDSAGRLYGTTSGGPGVACNGGCGTVFSLTPNSDGTWSQSILYNFEGGSDGIEPVAGLPGRCTPRTASSSWKVALTLWFGFPLSHV